MSNATNVSAKPKRRRASAKSADDYVENLERSSMSVKDPNRKVPRPIIVDVKINGCVTRALVDSGSTTDFISTRLVDQLKLQKNLLEKALPVQMTVQGSTSKVFYNCRVPFQYQEIDGKRTFDVANIGSQSYDVILGTPFMYQHQVVIGLNPTRTYIGSVAPLPMIGDDVAELLSAAAETVEKNLEHIRQQMLALISDLSRPESEIDLPPFRAINHRIPIIDKNKKYPYRPSKCPEALRPLWNEKRNSYL
ncbi:hypothetical protein K435DRAFT_704004, partial [Dendrothele bispora CBS 962.96]